MELFRVMFRMNAETTEVTVVKAVASTANQLLQFGMRIRTERVIMMDQVRISVIQRKRSIEAKSVIRQENRPTSVMWIAYIVFRWWWVQPSYTTEARSEATGVWRWHDSVRNILGTIPELFRVQQMEQDRTASVCIATEGSRSSAVGLWYWSDERTIRRTNQPDG